MTNEIPSVTSTMKMPSFAMTRWRQARDRSDDLSEAANRGRTAAVDVLYIGGCQRSGSTLLDRMLGQTHGHVSAGEVTHLWARGLSANDLCGCGERFADCPFWTEVGSVAFGGWSALDAAETLGLQRRVDRNRYIIFMLWPALSPRYRRDLSRYAAILDRLYRAIRQVGGDGSSWIPRSTRRPRSSSAKCRPCDCASCTWCATAAGSRSRSSRRSVGPRRSTKERSCSAPHRGERERSGPRSTVSSTSSG